MSLSRLLASDSATQICPLTALPPPVLNQCIEWEEAESSRYDCTNDEYLATFAPGQYDGVVANYLSFNTAQSTGHFVDRAGLFERCTGATINFAEATDIAEDPIKDIGSASSTGAELYDGYLMIYSFTSEASSLGLLETLNDRIRSSNALLRYEDILPKVRNMGEYRKDGRTNIDLLMADGDFFVPVVRIDLLERDGLPLPHTWEDVVELANRYNGTDLNDDGVADDFGVCIYPRTGSGFNDAWIPELMYSTWATTDQTRGIQQGFFFDEETFEPRIGRGFERAMDVWRDLWKNSADGCTTSNFVEGRCAVGLAPPGCWKGIFVNSEEGGVAWRNKTDGSVLRDENGKALWRPTMKDGSYAEPYRLRPFGSLEVIDRLAETDRFVECDPTQCPMAEKIPESSRLADDDRAKVLVDSPHVGKLINRVPFYWSGGYGTGIRKSADEDAKDLMWDFFVYVNTPITSVDDVVQPSWLDSWRYSQLESYERNFQKGGWSYDSWNEHQKVMLWALGNDVNSALTLRLPGVLTYTRDVMLDKFTQYMDGSISMDELKPSVVQGWNDATQAQGKLTQLQIYRASLGLDPMSEFDLCRLHRDEMDAEDPSVCRKYDPEETNMVLIITIIAVLGGIIVFGAVGFGIWWIVRTYREKERLNRQRERQYEAILKDSIDNMNDLQHPMVLIQAGQFLEIGSLKSYETLRDHQGNNIKLKVLDNMKCVRDFKRDGRNKIVFLSHQWLGWGMPDPENTHYNAMCAAVRRSPAVLGLPADDLDSVYVWVDFVSISQTHRGMQSLAIGSLPAYASVADCFSIIAPEALHKDSNNVCNPETYNMRGWCRAEMLSKVCATGLRDMYLVSGDGSEMEPVTESTPLSFKMFKGDFSCCQLRHTVGTGQCDMETLRVPALGLYSLALRRAECAHVKKVLEVMKRERESFFPSEYEFEGEGGSETRELFGPLIEKMEHYVRENFGEEAKDVGVEDKSGERRTSYSCDVEAANGGEEEATEKCKNENGEKEMKKSSTRITSVSMANSDLQDSFEEERLDEFGFH